MTWTRRIIRTVCLLALALPGMDAAAQNYASKGVRIGIFSSTPLEDIKAVSDKGVGVIITKTREVVVQLGMKTLEFDRKLMQEHFNENFVESDKFPNAKFKGLLDPSVDLSRDGEYNANVSGVLSLHGVDKQRSIPCKVSVKSGMVTVESQFKVACVDHNIEIPRLVFAKIAESISVKLSGQFSVSK